MVKMIHAQEEIPYEQVTMDCAKDTEMKVLVDGPNFVMRQFKICKEGNTPMHQHPWEHENYILSGTGKVIIAGEETAVKKGDSILIPSNTEHAFKNESEEDFEMICLIPKSAEYNK